MSDSHANTPVSANYRFVGAYQEVNTRIAQRQQALTIYASLVLSLLAAMVALKPGAAAADLPIEWLAMGFPLASCFLAALSYKAERALTNLRQFLCALERIGNADRTLPSYNADPMWAINANSARRFQDYAAAMLAGGGNLLGISVAAKVYPQRFADDPAVLWLAAAVAVASVLALLLIPRHFSYTPEKSGSAE